MNNLKWISTMGLGLVMLFIAGCAASAHIEKDPSFNLADYRTYNWMKKQDAGRQQSLVAQHIRNSVNKELANLGFRLDSGNPDILVDYDVLVEKGSRRESEPVYSQPYFRQYFNPYTRRFGTIYFPSQFMGIQNYQVPVTEGTITLTMVDAESDKTIWQGWATDVLSSRQMTSNEVKTTVKSILKKLK
jgi:hypothetical protein